VGPGPSAALTGPERAGAERRVWQHRIHGWLAGRAALLAGPHRTSLATTAPRRLGPASNDDQALPSFQRAFSGLSVGFLAAFPAGFPAGFFSGPSSGLSSGVSDGFQRAFR